MHDPTIFETWIRMLVFAGGGIFLLMGAGHVVASAIDTLRPTWFTPQDDRVRTLMCQSALRWSDGRMNLWDAWLGLNLSHGVGVSCYGLVAAYGSVVYPWLTGSLPALIALFLVAVVYRMLARRFWHPIPAVGAEFGVTCFGVALLLRALPLLESHYL